MVGWIRRHVTFANMAIVLALLFAMTGGAYAAKRYLITSTKQISPSVLAALKGKSGANGLNGAPGGQGTQGAQGPQGPQGAQGERGPAGNNGADGKDGGKGATGATGSRGVTGPEGVCSTAACALPKGVSEHGVWTIHEDEGASYVTTSLSFPIPLAAALDEEHVHYIGLEEGEDEAHQAAAITSHECEGTSKAPKAASGQLCVFTAQILGLGTFAPVPLVLTIGNVETGSRGAGRSGASFNAFTAKATEEIVGSGDWVVTG